MYVCLYVREQRIEKYVYMYVCMPGRNEYVCMYVPHTNASMYACLYVCIPKCMCRSSLDYNICMYVCMFVCMLVCMSGSKEYVCMYV